MGKTSLNSCNKGSTLGETEIVNPLEVSVEILLSLEYNRYSGSRTSNTFLTSLVFTKQLNFLLCVSLFLSCVSLFLSGVSLFPSGVSLFFFLFLLGASLFSFSCYLLSLILIWSSHTSLGDRGLRIIFWSWCWKEILLVKPSCTALVLYCHGLPNSI